MPKIGGDLMIKEGSISPPKQSGLGRNSNSTYFRRNKRKVFPEENWDRQTTFDLFPMIPFP